MKKVLLATMICLLLLGGFQIALASDGSFSKSQVITDISGELEKLTADIRSNGKFDFGKTAASDDCVEVDIELPDTVLAENPMEPSYAEGYFELTNCGDETTVIWLTFTATINISDLIDTTFVFPDIPVQMGAGEVIAREVVIPLPPFDGVYTICVDAVSGEAQDNDCATMVVIGTEFPGYPFDAPGVLVQGTNCVLFAPFNGMYDLFVLDNYGDFVVGDTVYVAGMLVYDCETECVDATGCIIENSIEPFPGPDPGIPFEGPGVLVQGTDCVLFAPGGNYSILLTLENYGDFGVGDSVYVAGILYIPCETECSDADGCITENTIEAYNGNNDYPIQVCGVLVQGTDCVLLEADGTYINDTLSTVLFALDNYGEYGVGDTVCVFGILDLDCVSGCSDADACIHDNTIEGWNWPEYPINACGVLVQGTECVLFMIGNPGGGYGYYKLYLLDNYGSFQVGDSVCVVGILQEYCENDCPDADGCIVDNTITGWEMPDYPIEAPGVLIQGTDCVLFVLGYGNAPGPFVLDNYGEFQVGDEVWVSGILDMDCETECSDAQGCIIDNTIDSLYGGGPDTMYVEGCGALIQGTDCVLFNYVGYNIAGSFVLDDYGTFVVGDSVFVSGLLDLYCQTECSDANGCIINNTIDICGGGGDPTYPIEGPGILVQDTGCVLFALGFNQGSGTPLFVLDNYGGFQVGDTVFVSGTLDPNCTHNCPAATACIIDNTIESWPAYKSPSQIDPINYPNPFNPYTTISFNLSAPTNVSLTVFNVLGQEVNKLYDDMLSAGSHSFEWGGTDSNGRELSSGMYFYRIQTNDEVITKKMLMVK